LDYGIYYWTVEPWALEKFQGSCTNGVWWFQVMNEANYAFEFKTTAEPRIKQEQGSSTVIPFSIKNTGQKALNLTPSLSLVGGGNVTDLFTYKWPSLNRFQQYSLQLQQELDIVFEIMHVSDSAPIGNYTLNFTFTNQYGIKETVLIQMEIVAKSLPPEPEPDPTNLGPLIALGIVAVILIMFVIGGLYFFLVKKKTKETHRDIEAELDQMEGDYVTGASSLRVAPQPKGLKSGPLPSTKAGAPKAPTEEEADEDGIEWEAPKLAEEDSEDSWMNLVASETIDEVSKSETVEEDKLVQTDKEKSLKDLLFEMSDEEEK
jgi:hypothetical protein